jgi:hypothetical protein
MSPARGLKPRLDTLCDHMELTDQAERVERDLTRQHQGSEIP